MSSISNDSLEAEGIFVGKAKKEDLINYFMKQQRLATIKKLEENDREISPDLSESFEIYLQQKKKKIEMEKKKLDSQEKKTTCATTTFSKDMSCIDESFLELEKMCENTLTLNNVSEFLADLTTMEIKNSSEVRRSNVEEETRLFEIEQPSYFLDNTSFLSSNDNSPLNNMHDENRPSTIMEVTETSLSYKTTQSHFQSIESSINYQTANDKTIETTVDSSRKNQKQVNDCELISESSLDEKILQDGARSANQTTINDTLDEIDFLLSQAQKINDNKALCSDNNEPESVKKIDSYISPLRSKISKVNLIDPPKGSPSVRTFSPLSTRNISPMSTRNSPLSNFKCPKQPISATKTPQYSKINSKKFQHIVSPVSRYIQTSESVLNANVRVQYTGSGSKKQFNFRDSENFNKSLNNSVKSSALPLRVKTNYSGNNQAHNLNSPQTCEKNKKNFDVFANNTFNDSDVDQAKLNFGSSDLK